MQNLMFVLGITQRKQMLQVWSGEREAALPRQDCFSTSPGKLQVSD